MVDAVVRIEVVLVRHGEGSLLVKAGNGQEKWIHYNVIEAESEIFERTPAGSSGVLVIPEWKAIDLGWG
jgi:hypothetical protein